MLHLNGNVVGDNAERKGLLFHFGLVGEERGESGGDMGERADWVHKARGKRGKYFQKRSVKRLEIHIREEAKTVEIWLTKAEKGDSRLRAQLQEVYAACRRKKYLAAVFESGEKDLYQGTLDLLIYNRRCSVQMDFQREKQGAKG